MSDAINGLLNDAANSAASVLGESGGKVSEALMKMFGQQDNPFVILLEGLKNGELTADEYQIELDREKQVLQGQLVTLEIVVLSEAQKAVNALISSLTSAAKAAL
ncbi:MAG: hypothetical protein HRT35_36440 [Algicola sp.]|nr:hypothetical protein [Algicola sp.]